MIRRQFMKFAPKEHDEKKVKKTLEKHNVPIYEGNAPAKFGQFGSIAKDLTTKHRKQYVTPEGGNVAEADKTFGHQQKALYGGGNGTGTVQNADARNPYAIAQPNGNPYAQPSSSGNPYGQNGGNNPYGTPEPSNPYARASEGSRQSGADFAASSPYANASTNANPYQSRSQHGSNEKPRSSAGKNPYGEDPSAKSSYGGDSSAKSSYGGDPYAKSSYGEDPYAKSSYGEESSYASSPYAKPSYGEDPSYAKSYANSSAKPSHANSHGSTHEPSDDFDELNRTHTELADSDDELMHSGASIYGGKAPSVRSMATSTHPARPHDAALGGINEQDEDFDELNQMPSEFVREPGYTSGQQLFEDSEDEDVENVKTEIRQVKQESLASTRRALQIAHEAETSGRNTLGMLGDQSERLGNSAKTVSIGRVQARVAEANADELQRLNRSIFIPNVSNPFNSRRRQQMKEQRLKGERAYDEMEQQSLERMQRESERRVTDGLNGAGDGYSETALRIQQRMNRDNPERKMYQFEADSEDEDMEDELEQNLEGISQAAKRLHGLSLKINDEVTAQNERVEEMGGRVEDLDFHLHKSTAKMSTLH